MASMRDAIATVPEGADWDKVKRELRSQLSPWLDEEEAKRRAELRLRHYVFTAYSAAQSRLLDAHIDAFPYRKYITRGDGKVRPAHAALNGLILPADSSFWRDHTPPWEYNCRCRFVGITAEEAGEIADQEDAANVRDDERTVIPADSRAHLLLENEGKLIRRRKRVTPDGSEMITETIDVRSPRQKEGRQAYHFDPRDLRPWTMDELRERYAQDGNLDLYEKFEAYVSKHKVNGVPVVKWLEGANLPPDKLPGLQQRSTKHQEPGTAAASSTSKQFADILKSRYGAEIAEDRLDQLSRDFADAVEAGNDQVELEFTDPYSGAFSINVPTKAFMKRRFFKTDKGELGVDHEFLSALADETGKGYGKGIFRHLLKFYDEIGAREITVHASLDKGGYAWARFGFLPKTPAQWDNLVLNLNTRAHQLKGDGVITDAQFAEIQALLDHKKPRNLWAIAGLRGKVQPGDSLPDEADTVGKALLFDQGWGGRLDLKNRVQRQVLEQYINYDTKSMTAETTEELPPPTPVSIPPGQMDEAALLIQLEEDAAGRNTPAVQKILEEIADDAGLGEEGRRMLGVGAFSS